METLQKLALIILSTVLVNNFVMSKFLGCCPFLGVSKKVHTAIGMGVAVTFVMAMASVITYLVQYYILYPTWLTGLGVAAENVPDLRYLQTIAFILCSSWRWSSRSPAPRCTPPWVCISP